MLDPWAPRDRFARSRRVYRALTRLYPPAFRRRHATDMEHTFVHGLATELEGSGWLGLVRCWIGVLVDTATHAGIEWLASGAAPLRHGVAALAIVGHELRAAVRSLLARPGGTGAVVASMAIALAANVLVYAALDELVYRSMSVPDADRLIRIHARSPFRPQPSELSYPEYREVRATLRDYADVTAHTLVHLGLETEADSEVVWGEMVADNYFVALGLEPAAGSWFPVDADQLSTWEIPIVLGHRIWERRFGSTARLERLQLRANGMPVRVVGVAPRGFEGTEYGLALDLWMPLAMRDRSAGALAPSGVPGDDWRTAPEGWLEITAKLHADATLDRTRAAINARVANAPAARPGAADVEFLLEPERLVRLDPAAAPIVPVAAALIHGLLLLVLCAAAANVVNLTLGRLAERRGELAVRLALGASHRRLFAGLLAEAAVTSSIACALGLALAAAAIRAMSSSYPAAQFPVRLDAGLPAAGVGYALALTGAATLFVVVPSALAAASVSPPPRTGTPGPIGPGARAGVRGGLLAGQVAAALVLLVATGGVLQRVAREQAAPLGFASRGVLAASVDLQMGSYAEPRGRLLQAALLDDLRSMAGVGGAAIVQNLPLGDRFQSTRVALAGSDGPGVGLSAEWNRVSDGYFAVLEIPLRGGRFFDARDAPGSRPVAIVSETLAGLLAPAGELVGRSIAIDPLGQAEIVGVVGDTSHRGLLEAPLPIAYVSIRQSYAPEFSLLIKGTGSSAQLAETVKSALRARDPGLPLFYIRTLDSQLTRARWWSRAAATVTLITGAFATLLAAIGIGGAVGYAMRRRRFELGVRLAVGADPRALVRILLHAGLVPSGVGATLGLSAIAVAARVLGVAGAEAGPAAALGWLSAGAFATLAVVTAIAVYVPARRLRELSPAVVLRQS